MPLLDAVRDKLEADGVAGGSTAWELFSAFLPPTDDQVVVVFETGGRQPEADPVATRQYDFPSFQIRSCRYPFSKPSPDRLGFGFRRIGVQYRN